MSSPSEPLLHPLTLADLDLLNRVIMAPMTRARANNPDLAPTELHATYYAQRASAGLIVTEGTWVSAGAIGYPNVPGIYSDAQIAGWRRVTAAVHDAGGRIFLQIGHAGANPIRTSVPANCPPVRRLSTPRKLFPARRDRLPALRPAPSTRPRSKRSFPTSRLPRPTPGGLVSTASRSTPRGRS